MPVMCPVRRGGADSAPGVMRVRQTNCAAGVTPLDRKQPARVARPADIDIVFVPDRRATILHATRRLFRSVEQRDDRPLRQPVLVGAGVVMAGAYEARPWGAGRGGASVGMCPSDRRTARWMLLRASRPFRVFDTTRGRAARRARPPRRSGLARCGAPRRSGRPRRAVSASASITVGSPHQVPGQVASRVGNRRLWSCT